MTPTEIAALLEQVGTAASAAAAEQLRPTLRELFVDAVEDGLIARSPAGLVASGPAGGIY